MLRYLKILLFVLFLSGYLTARPIVHPKQLGIGTLHSCVLDELGVQCWGNNDQGQTSVPPLKNPKFLLAGSLSYTCALDEDGLQCWGSQKYQNLQVSFKNPSMVAGWGLPIFALEEGKLKTYPINSGLTSFFQGLESPTMISAVAGAPVCILDAKGAHCFGDRVENVPTLGNSLQISVGWLHACSLHDGGVTCWGDNSYGQTLVPQLQGPSKIATSIHTSCAATETGVKCWGNPVIPDAPEFKDPTAFELGGHHGCVIIKDNVKCWGSNGQGQLNVPQ